ncbi:hypothetical protein L226DRAFT_260397 [Lentinus tigrinus ALCF2SS1-7]|uniref:uncharacterized protein n=1 Tax=Lentinus tigrinus ALCF2SS1-7 TaxID=1328758 RepID=UPI001165E8AA|nr:hypothetical protein L226DRAFT_260397 [Lentinus tigrinus ALCF2SS1-7]
MYPLHWSARRTCTTLTPRWCAAAPLPHHRGRVALSRGRVCACSLLQLPRDGAAPASQWSVLLGCGCVCVCLFLELFVVSALCHPSRLSFVSAPSTPVPGIAHSRLLFVIPPPAADASTVRGCVSCTRVFCLTCCRCLSSAWAGWVRTVVSSAKYIISGVDLELELFKEGAVCACSVLRAAYVEVGRWCRLLRSVCVVCRGLWTVDC